MIDEYPQLRSYWHSRSDTHLYRIESVNRTSGHILIEVTTAVGSGAFIAVSFEHFLETFYPYLSFRVGMVNFTSHATD